MGKINVIKHCHMLRAKKKEDELKENLALFCQLHKKPYRRIE